VKGYQRPTTPRLDALREEGKLQLAQGLAASVATGSSLPLMLNVVREPGNVEELRNGSANLFRRAKEAGYKTFWLSSQESKMLNKAGVRYIDVVTTEEDAHFELAQKGDKAVFSWLEQIEWGEKNFVFLLLRTAHKPYLNNYDQEEGRYGIWPTHDLLTPEEQLSNAYDNSLRYGDSVLAGTIDFISRRLAGDTLWVFTSDHGQMLGEEGKWGHNRLNWDVASVPMVMFQKRDEPEDKPYILPDDDVVSHYEMGKWLLGKMGYRLHNPNEETDVHYFHGEKLLEDNLFVRVIETPEGLFFCPVSLVSKIGQHAPCTLADGRGVLVKTFGRETVNDARPPEVPEC
jgi:hypothetical protein